MDFLNEPADGFGFDRRTDQKAVLSPHTVSLADLDLERASTHASPQEPLPQHLPVEPPLGCQQVVTGRRSWFANELVARRCCQPIANLFGPGSGVLPVFGTREALELLRQAIQVQGLFFFEQPGQGRLELATAFDYSLRVMDERRELPPGYYASFVEHMNSMSKRPSGCSTNAALQAWLARTAGDEQFYTRIGFVTSKATGSKEVSVRGPPPQNHQNAIVWIYQWQGSTGPKGTPVINYCPINCQQASILGPLRVNRTKPVPSPSAYTPPPSRKSNLKRRRQDSEDPPTVLGKRKQHHKTSPRNSNTLPTTNPKTLQPPPSSPPTHTQDPQTLSFAPEHLIDPILFALPLDKITNNLILYLATRYTNTEIFEHINAFRQPGKERLREMNVITKRLTTAVRNMAKRKGVSEVEVREGLKRVKAEGGVRRGRGRTAGEMVARVGSGGMGDGDGDEDGEGTGAVAGTGGLGGGVIGDDGGVEETQVASQSELAGGGESGHGNGFDGGFDMAGGLVLGDEGTDQYLTNDFWERLNDGAGGGFSADFDAKDFELFGDMDWAS
ncbi:hypothetical protein MBLNU230_g5093t1 [Neophaeotheca triangularis]